VNKVEILLSATIALALAQAGALYAHGKEEHDEKIEYDATTEVFGEYAQDLVPTKTIMVSMSDSMRFTPAKLAVSAGDVVKFVISNDGQLKHEFVLGTRESLEEHAELMIRFPNMEHEEPYMAHVDPGESMEIVWKFSNAGSFAFGCLLPGHFAAGMKGSVTVN